MIFSSKIVKGKLVFNQPEKCKEFLDTFIEGNSIEIEIKKPINTRTDKQNRSLHLWFNQVSEALNKDGFDMRVFINKGVDIMWTPYTVKEYLFRPMQDALFGKKSTKDLNTDEIDKVIEPINKAMGERTGIHVPFPSIEELYFKR